jgi:hypothetical protein
MNPEQLKTQRAILDKIFKTRGSSDEVDMRKPPAEKIQLLKNKTDGAVRK